MAEKFFFPLARPDRRAVLFLIEKVACPLFFIFSFFSLNGNGEDRSSF